MANKPQPIENLPAENPWARLPGETSLAYNHFIKYREMDPTIRSIRRLCEEIERKPEQLFFWSRQWRWVERVTRWDDYCEEQGRLAQLDKIRKAGEIRVDVVLAGLEAIRDRLVGRDGTVDTATGEVKRDGVDALDLNRLDAKDLAALGNVLTKMQTMAEEAAGVRVNEPNRVDVRLSFDLEHGTISGEGHRVVEQVAAQKKIEQQPRDVGELDSGSDPETDG